MLSKVHKLKRDARHSTHTFVSLLPFSSPMFPTCAHITSRFSMALILGVLPQPALASDGYHDITPITAGPALFGQFQVNGLSQDIIINDSVSHDALKHQARGVIKAGEEAIIASGMTARLLRANYKPGQRFNSGALLAKFDCTQQEAELKALEQAHETLSLQYKNQDHLFKAGAAGELDVSMARSEMAQASAERDALSARMKHCHVYAPYAGIIVDKHVASYETPAQNAPLYTVHRAGDLEISVIIPSKWLRWIDKGAKFKFHVDETGAELTGKISRIGASVDPVSQTIEVTGKMTGATHGALSGMSGVAQFDRKDAT